MWTTERTLRHKPTLQTKPSNSPLNPTRMSCRAQNTRVRRNLHYKIEPSNSPLRQHTPTLQTRALKHLSQQKPTLQTRTLKLTSQPEGPVQHRTHSSEETYTTNENPQNSPLSQQTPTLQIRTLKPTSQSAGPPDPAGCRKTCRSAGRCAQTWGRRTCGTSAAPPAWSASPPWSAGSQSMTPAAPQTWCSHPSPLQQSDTSLPAAWWVGGTSLLRVVSHLRCAPTYWREKNWHRHGHPVSLSRYDRYAAHIVFLHCVMLNCVALNMLKAKNQHRYGFIYPLSGLYDRYAEHIALAITV